MTVSPSYPGCTFTPPSYNVVLVNQDVTGVDFTEVVCIPTATPTLTPSQTQTPNPLMTSTQTPSNTPTRHPNPDANADAHAYGQQHHHLQPGRL